MRALLIVVVLGSTAISGTPPSGIDLPDGKPGIGFDDLQYSARLGSVLAPTGRAGVLARIHTKTSQVIALGTFSKSKQFDGGHDFGITSVADTGSGLAVTDRTTEELILLDDNGKVTSRAKLAGGPDYVRYVEPTKELWVTEPDKEQIEVFSLSPLKSVATIAVKGGPESLVIDAVHGHAYTNLWHNGTVAIDLQSHSAGKAWSNGCADSRGIDLDSARQLVLVGCADGTAIVIPVLDRSKLFHRKFVDGMDIIAYSPARHHLYLAGSNSADTAIVLLTDTGELKLLGKGPGAAGGHCVTTDDAGHAYVCDPKGGRLIVVDDKY
jgi:hypothetical protein